MSTKHPHKSEEYVLLLPCFWPITVGSIEMGAWHKPFLPPSQTQKTPMCTRQRRTRKRLSTFFVRSFLLLVLAPLLAFVCRVLAYLWLLPRTAPFIERCVGKSFVTHHQLPGRALTTLAPAKHAVSARKTRISGPGRFCDNKVGCLDFRWVTIFNDRIIRLRRHASSLYMEFITIPLI